MIISAGLVLPGSVAQAQTAEPVSRAAASNAVGIGLDIDADALTPLPVPRVDEAFGDAYQSFPPGAAAPNENTQINVPAAPLASSATVSGMAGATGAPQAVASGQAEAFKFLLPSPQAPLITADLVRGQSNSDCVNDPNGAGTIITGLKVNGTEVLGGVNGVFTPNYEAPGVSAVLAGFGLRLIINEQHPAANGRGFVVNALHLFDIEPNSAGALMDGDIRVGHAETTVNCPNGRGSTGLTSNIVIDKDASVSSAAPGATFTYTVKIDNKSTQACRVNQFIDHLAPAFEFVSTAGDLGTAATTEAKAGGITDVIIKPAATTIAPGGSATQTYVIKVKDDAAPATYFNTVELLCAALGNFIASDAPVTVTGGRLPQCSDKIDNDGDGKIDFPADPGCTSAQDDSEIDFECSDKVDNDGDGKIDFPADPGCSSALDDSETNSLPRTGADGAVALVGGALLLGAAITARKLKSSL
ncbi:MAG TPA: hypothetical protein VNA14_05980 [Mycobacteriales bacterium]|nr:hypothetical protein [Mycobacteriales bacterium]